MLSWAYAITPDGVRRSAEAPSSDSALEAEAGPVYTFEGFRVAVQRRVLSRVGGDAITLGPKVFDTLLYFVERPGQLLDKQELIKAIWPNVIVEENNLNQTISTLRRVLGEVPGQHRFIVTEPGRGYRFVASVQANNSETAGKLDAGRPGIRQNYVALYSAIAMSVVISLVGVLWYLQLDRGSVLPNSVAVLPLENSSPPENAFYADGMHVEIINQLSKLSNLNVIVRESVLPYATDRPPLNRIAAELKAQSIVTGSFQYVDGQIQVTVQLVDPATSTPLWSNDYREDFSEIFDVQSDIAMNVANALSVELSAAEQDAILARPTDSEAAYTAYLRYESLRATSARSQLMLDELNEAIGLDPRFALAHAHKAQWYASAFITVFGADAAAPSDWAELERLVRESAETALDLDPDMWVAHVAMGVMHKSFWRWTDASRAFARASRTKPPTETIPVDFALVAEDWVPLIRAQRRAVELNPNSGLAHWALGVLYAWSGNAAAAADEFRAAIDLVASSPVFRVSLAHAETALGNDEIALRELRAAEELGFIETTLSLAVLAYAYAQIDHADEAKRLFDLLGDREPDPRQYAGTWALAHLAVGDYERARESLEIVVGKIADEEPDAGYLALKLIRWNVSASPVLDRPPFSELRTQLRGH